MTDFAYDIIYDTVLGCFVWLYNGNGMCLGAETLEDARNEVSLMIDNGIYPDDYYYGDFYGEYYGNLYEEDDQQETD